MMRNGQILAEDSPKYLLDKYNCPNLDDLFLRLSILNETGQSTVTKSTTSPIITLVSDNQAKSNGIAPEKKNNNSLGGSYINRLHAVIFKNALQIRRRFFISFTLLFLPAIELIFCLALGQVPWGIHFGFVNNEIQISSFENCQNYKLNSSCDNLMLSCNFVEMLNNLESKTFVMKEFQTHEDAIEGVRSGEISGFISFPDNFTQSILQRMLDGVYADKETVSSSRISLTLDLTLMFIGIQCQRVLYATYPSLVKKLIEECEPAYVPELADGPFLLEEPIYGKKENALQHVVPSLALVLMYFSAISVTGMSYVMEKKQGMLERTVVAGISTTEVITAEFITQIGTITIQMIFTMAVVFGVFGLSINEQIGWIALLVIMQGTVGMLMGIFLSTITDQESIVIQLAIALTMPCIILGGLMWPTEALPLPFRYAGYIAVPQTFPAESLRSMINRNWGITHANVWPGFVVSLIWMIVLWTIATFLAKRSVSPNNK